MIYQGITHVFAFLEYFLLYRLLFHARFVENLAWKIVALLGSLAASLLLFRFEVFSFGEKAIVLTCFISIMALLKEDRIRGLFLWPIIALLSASVNVFFTYAVSFLIGMPYAEFYETESWMVVAKIPEILILLILNFVIDDKNYDGMTKLSIPKYLITLLGAGCLFILVGVSQGYMLGQAEAALFIRLTAVCFTLSVVLFTILIVWQALVEKRAYAFQMENEQFRNYLDKQEAHIHDIVESDRKIRSFRHDIRAHITALETGIEEGDLEFLKQYIARMKEENEKLAVRRYTGIAAVDAVISEYHQKALERDIEWKWEGNLISKEVMEAFDLCVLFSNLLSNAVEAAVQVEQGRERFIRVYCGTFQNNLVIRVSNACRSDVTEVAQGTSKSDKENHGYGIKNVEKVVAKVKGEYRHEVKDGTFQSELIL